ncbi:VENN motif pre-toxin domain-containing protein [Brenneria uluponensis]|uniref:VENN motif pre-toxin domain-containing protein n=1 Tax=Brenneria uluponensis TaxID=3057057 RepID=UPI0028F08BE3|nr:VENN motif pre-toxin domain-containing protein [Brenneria ulupoensis]
MATATLAVIPKTTGSVRPDTPALKQTAQLIGEIGGQAIDIVRTQGAIKAEKAAEASGESKVNRPADDGSEKDWEDYKKALTETPAYKAAMKDYGTGGDFQRAAQAATAALAGGDIQKALAGASAPYLAQLVKAATMPQDGSKATASDIAANAMGHAVVGAVVAELSGQNVAGGAVGAAGGELAARSIMAYLYPGKETKDLTEAEKQSVSALATVASGLASGLVTGDTTGAASGAQAGRNAVENNFFAPPMPVVVGGEAAAMAGAVGQGVRQGGGNADDEDMGGSCEGTREQCAVRDGTRGPGHTELPIADKDPTGGKLENPAPAENTATTLTTPDQSGENGASDTGNPEGAPATAGNTTTTPIPDGPNKDDLAYLAIGDKPANLSPEGSARAGAFNEAKRQSGIPVS